MADIKSDYENILDYFPFDTFRNNQKEILKEFRDHLLDPEVSYIICQAATGTGKSALALAAAQASKSAYIATANKMLQDQYINDFSDIMVDLKGRGNYRCYNHRPAPGKPAFNCGNSPCRVTEQDRAECSSRSSCEYHNVRRAAAKSKITSFNFASALPYLNYLSHFFPKRNLLICDEAHSIWSWVSNFIGIDLNLKLLKKLNVLDKIPNYSRLDQYLDLVAEIQSAIKFYLSWDGIDAKIVDDLENLKNRLKLFDIITSNKTDTENFILDKTFDKKDYSKIIKLSFKPVVVSKLLHDYLFQYGKKTILLSAVILDFRTYMELLGIDPEKARIITIDSTFPVKNRPFYTYEAVGGLNKSNINTYTPDLSYKTHELMTKYSNVKGMVHGVSWSLCKRVYESLPAESQERILFADGIGNKQTDLIEYHQETNEPTVLLSPSMTEGVDLKDDLSRFQVILKMPYPFLGDPLIRKLMGIYGNDFYSMLTAQTLIQMYGRSIRSEKDFCDTYILDSNVKRFITQNRHIFPRSFIDAVVHRASSLDRLMYYPNLF